jgi:energy-coupling factor transporter ATP-binding protein EcfA2
MRPLFALRNIAVVNFYLYAQDFPIDSVGNTVFLGANGSGKSILLDAIQIVMTGMNKRYLDLNSRVSEGGKNTRTLPEACLGLLDDGEGYERQACLTYIALGFESSDGTRRCTAGVCLEAKASLSEETVLGLFIADNVILRFQDFVHPQEKGFKEKDWKTFLDEQRRKQHVIQTFQRQNSRSFLRQLYSIINGNARGTQLDPDRARAAMRQALSFDIEQITSVTQFVKNFLLDESPIDIETFKDRYATWRGLQKDIARVEAEIQQVETIRSQCVRVMEDQFNARFWAYGSQRAQYDQCTSIITRQEQEIAEMQDEHSGIEAYMASLAGSVQRSRDQFEAVERQISGSPAYEQIKRARSDRGSQEAARKNASIEAKTIFDALNALREAGESSVFPFREFPAIRNFVQAHLSPGHFGDYQIGWPLSPQEIGDVVSTVPPLSEVRSRIESTYQSAARQSARSAGELEDVERQLRNLHSGGTYMSKDTQDFLGDMLRVQVPAKTLAELADIAPGFTEWRGIIEAILGDWCDAVVVEPRFMDTAYDRFDSHYKATRTKLVQSENNSFEQELRAGTLAEAVTTDNKYARAFLNARLGRILRARSPHDIRKGDLAASIDGKYAHGRGIEYRRLPAIPRLGKSIREQQIVQFVRNQTVLKSQVTAERENECRLFAVLEALKRAEAGLVIGRDTALANLEAISNADLEIERHTQLIARLEALLPSDLLSEQQRLQSELKSYAEKLQEQSRSEKILIGNIGKRIGAMEEKVKERNRVAKQALENIPDVLQRFRRHNPSIGLECFVYRARSAYRKIAAGHSDSLQVRNYFDNLLREKRQSRTGGAAMRLSGAIAEYVQANPDQHPGFEWTQAISSEKTKSLHDWIGLRHRHLTDTVLRAFTTQVDKAVFALVETMVHDFLSRLRANIESVDRIKDDLNRRLLGSVFMGEVYQIRQERDQDKETIRYLIDRLDIVAPKASALMQSKPDPNDPDQVKINELIELLTSEGSDDAAHRRQLRELADYRNYFRFSIDICDPENAYRKISDLDRRRGKASGGQKFLPFYICLGVAAASAYSNHLGESKDVPPQSALLLMDEAFEKLDPENIYKIITFYKSLGLQLVMAAPKTHQALYQETFNTLISIVRVGRAITATAQHFQQGAHDLLNAENPMHWPRSYFEESVRHKHEATAK